MAISPERREELRKIAKDRVADLIENPESYGLDAGKKKLLIPEERTYTGPRGGRYRINSNGRKSYDVH